MTEADSDAPARGEALWWQARASNAAWIVPLVLLAAVTLLLMGLSTPVVRIEKFFFFDDEYSVVGGIANLFDHGNPALATIVLLFSIVFPVLKLAAVAWAWVWPLEIDARRRLLRWTALLGRWSMLDVFVVAVIVVLLQSSFLGRAEPRPGIYIFAAAIALSMLSALLVEHLASRYDGVLEPRE